MIPNNLPINSPFPKPQRASWIQGEEGMHQLATAVEQNATRKLLNENNKQFYLTVPRVYWKVLWSGWSRMGHTPG